MERHGAFSTPSWPTGTSDVVRGRPSDRRNAARGPRRVVGTVIGPLAGAARSMTTGVVAYSYDSASPLSPGAKGASITALPTDQHRLGSAKDVRAPARPVAATGFAAEDGMAGVRAAGRAGENAAGSIKNTERIPSATSTAAYRIPDELNATTLGEVKNVARLSYTSQLQDFAAYAQQTGRTFNLYVRSSTELSGPLQAEVDAGNINLIRSLP